MVVAGPLHSVGTTTHVWADVGSVVIYAAAVLYLLDLFRVFRLLGRLWPRLARVHRPSRGFFSFGRAAVLIGFGLTVVMGFAPSQPAKIAAAATLGVFVVTKEIVEWRRDRADLDDAPDQPEELAPTAEANWSSKTPALPLRETPEPSAEVPGRAAARAQHRVMDGVVELQLVNVMADMLGTPAVSCEVIDPHGARSEAQSLLRSLGHPLDNLFLAGFSSPRIAIVHYPTEFENAPPLMPGIYRVEWSETRPDLAILDPWRPPRRTHDAFRY